MKGMIVDIYTNSIYKNCSGHGISQYHNSVLLIGMSVPLITEWTPDYPTVELREFHDGYLFAEPMFANYRAGMMGGSFIWSSDSRFRQQVSERPIPLHDRFENSCRLGDYYFAYCDQYATPLAV